MKLYEGIDYWVRRVEFPNTASESVAVSHGDGTFTIYLNTLFPPDRLEERLCHELRHLEQDHFYRDALSIRQIEHQADGRGNEVRVMPGPAPQIAVFRSASLPPDVSFGFYVPDQSLRPVLCEGQLVLCDAQPVHNGDVALFGWEGATLCRQYYQDPMGMTYLHTLNPAADRDCILIRPGQRTALRCYGRVRLSEPPALPEVSP